MILLTSLPQKDYVMYIQKPNSNESSRGSLYEWFIPQGQLKNNILFHVQGSSQFTLATPHNGAFFKT